MTNRGSSIGGYNQQVDLPGNEDVAHPAGLYQFFLLHPDGVRLVDLRDDHHLSPVPVVPPGEEWDANRTG